MLVVQHGALGFLAIVQLELVANCAKIGVTLDTSAYLTGWQKGIDLFCTPKNGWRQGAQGQRHKLERCAGQPQEAAFRQQLQAGLEMSKLLEQRSNNAGMLQKLNHQMRTSRNPAERRSLQEQMDALDKVQAQLRRQMSALEANAPR